MSFATTARYWHTLRWLRREQVLGRLRRSLPYPSTLVAEGQRARAQAAEMLETPMRPPCMLGPCTFRFLDTSATLTWPAGWNDPRQSKLWLYNLHYFDDLAAEAAAARTAWHRELIARWIADNPIGQGNGWEPYPTSLRIVNWIKWGLAGNRMEQAWLDSLATQAHWLAQRIEWHLLGNHLLANAKALVFAGLYLEGSRAERWLTHGLAIYARELPEQILSDGGHFERSPMYHAIILEDVLDLINLQRAFPGTSLPHDTLAAWRTTAKQMLRWLTVMSHPDGQIGFFNDAAFAIAAEPRQLHEYARRLGLRDAGEVCTQLSDMRVSGYLRMQVGGAVALLDVAPVGPDYLPGHAHADTLSFELSLGDSRVVVNGGTSVYGTGPERERQRGTAAHSTVEIDGENSSEVWAGFRVARRARVHDVTAESIGGGLRASAWHDGYMRLCGTPVHAREWRMDATGLSVSDRITGGFRSAVARFHLHPAVSATISADGRSGSLSLPRARTLTWRASHPARIEASYWHPRFGVSIPSQCLAVPFQGPVVELEFDWSAGAAA